MAENLTAILRAAGSSRGGAQAAGGARSCRRCQATDAQRRSADVQPAIHRRRHPAGAFDSSTCYNWELSQILNLFTLIFNGFIGNFNGIIGNKLIIAKKPNK